MIDHGGTGGFDGAADGGGVRRVCGRPGERDGVLRRAGDLPSDVLRVPAPVPRRGDPGAAAASRRPTGRRRPPRGGGRAVVEVHDRLREQGWDAGARSVRDRMRGQGLGAPSDRTIHRILAGHGRVKASPDKRRRDSYRRFEAAAPNGMWQLDGTKRALADGTVVCILRVIDDHSRMLLATRVAPTENMADTWALLETAMTRHGRPALLLHDGSIAFSGVRQGRGQVTDLQWQLRRLGVHQIVSSPHHPQTCGKKGATGSPCTAGWTPPRRRDHHRPTTPGRRLRRGVQHRTPPPRHRPGHPRPALPGPPPRPSPTPPRSRPR